MMIASGFGSIVAQELGKLAVENSPIIKQIATGTAVEIGKKTVNLILSNNPRFESFLSQFGIHKFGGMNHNTLQKRARHRKISYSHH